MRLNQKQSDQSNKHRKLLCISLAILALCLGQAQSKYRNTEGEVHFNASTPLEDIDARNQQIKAVLETGTGNFAVMMLIKDFEFPRKLMQEHFNENYMESEQYPKAYFSGTIENFALEDLSTEAIENKINGKLTIHGITRKRTENVRLVKKGDALYLESTFIIRPEAHDIEVPKIVFAKIAQEVQVDIQLKLVAGQ